MNSPVLDRYRCPEQFIKIRSSESLSEASRFFRFGSDILCYGRSATTSRNGATADVIADIKVDRGDVLVPFDPKQIIDNLRLERYTEQSNELGSGPTSLSKGLYYFLRPLLPLALRRHLQKVYFYGWNKIAFPRWPLDLTVEDLLEALLPLCMEAAGVDAIPFIWFWPDGADSAAIMTHDVETPPGRDFCSQLMNINDSFGIPSSFQIVPESRYAVPPAFLDEIRSRGHEINIQDLNHDGLLFRDRARFEERIKSINAYGQAFGARGFRSAVLYRNLNWFELIKFEFDMSVPNVGHLEAQRGGCCTVFPYFVGKILEIPVTTTQDYTLFHVLGQYTIDLWKTQVAAVRQKHGLASFIVHPDYLSGTRPLGTYHALLDFLRQSRSEHGMWLTTANAINDWWRLRSQMSLVFQDGAWQISGFGKERATVAYARTSGGKIVYDHGGVTARQ